MNSYVERRVRLSSATVVTTCNFQHLSSFPWNKPNPRLVKMASSTGISVPGPVTSPPRRWIVSASDLYPCIVPFQSACVQWRCPLDRQTTAAICNEGMQLLPSPVTLCRSCDKAWNRAAQIPLHTPSIAVRTCCTPSQPEQDKKAKESTRGGVLMVINADWLRAEQE